MTHTAKTMRWLFFVTILFGSTNFYFNESPAFEAFEEGLGSGEVAGLEEEGAAGGPAGEEAAGVGAAGGEFNEEEFNQFEETDAARAAESGFGRSSTGAIEEPSIAYEGPAAPTEGGGLGGPGEAEVNLGGDVGGAAGIDFGAPPEIPEVAQIPNEPTEVNNGAQGKEPATSELAGETDLWDSFPKEEPEMVPEKSAAAGEKPATEVENASRVQEQGENQIEHASEEVRETEVVEQEVNASEQEVEEAKGGTEEQQNAAEEELKEAKAAEETEKAGDKVQKEKEELQKKIDDKTEEIGKARDEFEDLAKQHGLEENWEGKSPEEMREAVKESQLSAEEKAQLNEKIDNLEKLDGELNEMKTNLEKLGKEGGILKYIGEKLVDYAKWVGQELATMLFLELPMEIMSALQEEAALRALYETIMEEQTFGEIKMKVLPGLVPRSNPANGAFIYADTPGDYSNPQRCYFAAYNEADGEIAKQYIGPEVTHVINLNTGAVIDGSGVIEKVIPLFANEIVPGHGQSQVNVQSALEFLHHLVAGDLKTEVAKKSFEVLSGSVGGNKIASVLFAPNPKRLYAPPEENSEISLLLENSLHQFATPLELPSFGITIQELQGIGSLTYAFMNFEELFFVHGNDTATGNAIIETIIAGVDVTDPQKFPSQSSEHLTNAGITKGTALIGQDIYLYQTDNTAAAQFIRSHVHKVLQDYVYDYVVCVDANNNILPALIPKVNSNEKGAISEPVVEWVPNPNIMYVVSLLTGATFAPGNHGESLKKSDGTLDYSIANEAVKAVVAAYGASSTIMAQLGSMKFFAEMLIANGPFTLRDGIYAYRVTNLADSLVSSNDQTSLHKVDVLNLVGKAAQGLQLSSADEDLPLEKKQKMLEDGGGVYVYRIDNVLPGGSDEAFLPDYVVPVTVNQATGNYLIVPLGMQAAVQSGGALPSVSTQVTAIISLVTGKIYDSTYTLLPKAFTTDILLAQAPGKPASCPRPLPQGVICDGNYTVQAGGAHVPIATAFMETDLNPVNHNRTGNDLVKVWPFYFTLLNYDYCPAGISTSGNKHDILNYLEAGFMNINQPTHGAITMPVPLYRILPQVFTGIPWPSSVNAALKKSGSQTSVTSDAALGQVLEDLEKETIEETHDSTTLTIAQVHAKWRACLMANPDLKSKLMVSEGPHAFTTGKQGWWLSGEPRGLLSQVFLYSATPPMLGNALKGLWVAAQYGPKGGALQGNTLSDGSTVVSSPDFLPLATTLGLTNQATPDMHAPLFSIIRASDSFGLTSFSKIGTDYGSDNSLNALINIGTGAVLIKIVAPLSDGSSGEIVVPVANNWGELYQFDPTEITKDLQKTSKVSDHLAAYINSLQLGHTADQFGPSRFGQFNMFVARDDANTGNYVYQAYAGDSMATGHVYDYLVASRQDEHGAYILGGPVTPSTQTIVSLVSGVQYSRSGGQTVVYGSLLPSQSGTHVALKGFPTTVFSLMAATTLNAGSGNAVNKNLASKVLAANSDYVDHVAQKTTADEGQAPDLGYAETVLAALTAGKATYKYPDVTTLTAVPDASSIGAGNLCEDSAGNFYLKESAVASQLTSSMRGTKTVGYYAFNIAQPDDAIIQSIPTALYFEVSGQKITPKHVLYGTSAQAIAAAQGISISPTTGKQTRALPVERAGLTMSDADKNLVGGKDGTLMKLYQTDPVLTTKTGTNLYLYFNFGNGNNLTKSQTEQTKPETDKAKSTKAPVPSDVLLQVNSTKNSPYYLSLTSGIEYTIDGKPKSEDAYVFLPRAADKSFITTAPLVAWGEEQNLHLYVPHNFTAGVDHTEFTEYTVNPSGIMYRYVDSSGKAYDFTIINPSTNKADGNVYKVDVAQPTVALKTWTLDSSKTTPASVQTASNLSAALTEAVSGGLTASQRIYLMTASTDYTGGPLELRAVYDLVKDGWSLHDASKPASAPSVGEFEPIAKADASKHFTATVLHFVGNRGAGSSDALFKKFADKDDENLFRRVVVFNTGQSGTIMGFAFAGTYFSPHGSTNAYKNGQGIELTITQAVSPALYCMNNAKTGGVCQTRPEDQSHTGQLPTDVVYHILQSVDKSGPDLVYGAELPPLSTENLNKYYGSLKLRPIVSNHGVLTVVRNLNMKSLTQVGTDKVGRPAKEGESPESYSVYKQRLLESVGTFYDKQAATLQQSAVQMASAIQANNEAQQSFAYDASIPRPASLADQAPASIPAGPPVQKVIGNSSGYVTYLGQTSQAQVTAINAQKTTTLAQVNALFATIEKMIGKLFFDGSTLVFKVEKSDGLAAIKGYVSYPSASDPGGFLFDTKGIPTGGTLSAVDMQSLKAQVGNLVVGSTKPLRLTLPKVVGHNAINIPNFVSHGAPAIPRPTITNTAPMPTYTTAPADTTAKTTAPAVPTPATSAPAVPTPNKSTPATTTAPAVPTSNQTAPAAAPAATTTAPAAPAPATPVVATPAAQPVQPTQHKPSTPAPSASTPTAVTGQQPTTSTGQVIQGNRPSVQPRP